MAHETRDTGLAIQEWLRPILRFGMAGLLLPPGASKFITYGTSVGFFDSLGLPAPAILVPIVGALELVTASLLLVDRRARVAAVLAIPIMIVAAATAGPTWQNLGVLAAALGLITLDTWRRGATHDRN